MRVTVVEFFKRPDCRLAEGNPDEEKIGAFGVGMVSTPRCWLLPHSIQGFYSLFSVTDDPMVTSGGAHTVHISYSTLPCPKTSGWRFTGKTRRTRCGLYSNLPRTLQLIVPLALRPARQASRSRSSGSRQMDHIYHASSGTRAYPYRI